MSRAPSAQALLQAMSRTSYTSGKEGPALGIRGAAAAAARYERCELKHEHNKCETRMRTSTGTIDMVASPPPVDLRVAAHGRSA